MSGITPDGESRNLAVIAERIRSRRTTRLFLKQEVSRQLVRDAIELARWAPNHHLTEPWHFYLMGPKKIESSVDLIGTLIEETKNDQELAEFKRQSARAIPGWLLVTCRITDDELRQREDYASVCCAIQNLTLYLSEAGIASKWTTGNITRDPRFFELMGIDMDAELVVGLIWYGYPKTLPTQDRKAVDEILTETS